MNSTIRPVFFALALASSLAAQQPFASGNLVVVRVGAGATALTSAAQQVFVNEYTPTGTLVQSIALPTVQNGRTAAFTLSGTATSEGQLNLSNDGRYFSLAGYNATPGTANPGSSSVTAAARVVARFDSTGTMDTTTVVTNAFSSGAVRSAVTEDGSGFWVAGSNSGVQHVTFGTFTSTAASTGTPTNLRNLCIFNGQLYASSASGTSHGLSTVGVGVTPAGGAVSLLPGFSSVAGPSPYDFFFTSPNTCYIADDRATASGGGIQKWVQSNGTWSLAYTLSPSGTSVRSISGSIDNGVVTIYATSTTTTGNAIVSVVDNGAGSTFSTIATADANTVLRGIRVMRPRGSAVISGVGSPTTQGLVPTIGTTAVPTIGNPNFAITGGNFPAFSLGAVLIKVGNLTSGLPLPGAPAGCLLYVNLPEDILAGAFSDANGTASYGLPVPYDPYFIGLKVGAQWLVLDPGFTNPLPLSSSPGLQLILGGG